MKTLLITSSKTKVGKTFIAYHLYYLASEMNIKTYLIKTKENLISSLPEGYTFYIIDSISNSPQIQNFKDYITHILIPFRGRFKKDAMEDLIFTFTHLSKYMKLTEKISVSAIPNMVSYTNLKSSDREKAYNLKIHLFEPIRYYHPISKLYFEDFPVWNTSYRTNIKRIMRDILNWLILI